MKYAFLFAAMALAGCQRHPEIYRPPEPRRPYEIVEGEKLHYVNMNSPDAGRHIISGVLPELHDNLWRWALQSAEFRFSVPTTQKLKFQALLTVPEITLKDTGPVHLRISLDGKEFGTLDFKQPGEQLFEKDVPAGWLKPDAPVDVTISVDKLWIAQDGTKRGFIVTRLGFVQ